MELDKAIEERHSVRLFKSKKISYEKIIEAVDAALKAPKAGNIPSVKFIIVSDKEKIFKLAGASQQKFISQAQFVVAICSDLKQLTRSYEERGLVYARQQAGAAAENFLLKITELGLASCWVGAFSEETVKRILEIHSDEEIQPEVLLPVGYEFRKTKKRKNPNPDTNIYFNKYKNKYLTPLAGPKEEVFSREQKEK